MGIPENQDSPALSNGPTAAPTLLHRLRRRLIEPSPLIQEPDQRRQATLLTGFLLGLIVLAILAEITTILLTRQDDYIGYRYTALGVVFLAVAYAISRTPRVQLAAILAVVVALASLFLSGFNQPHSVESGFLDYVIIPLWLGSLIIDLKRLPLLIAASLAGVLVMPLLAPELDLNTILVGPFTFTLATSVMLLIITRHRDRLEQDRQAQLRANEARSRREAARAESLLRVAHRLNAQLDQDAVLAAIGEEVARALDTPISIVLLADPRDESLVAASAVGLPPGFIQRQPAFQKPVFDRTIGQYGRVFAFPDLRLGPPAGSLPPFQGMGFRSVAFAAMEYDQGLIGGLSAITVDHSNRFTEEQLLLLEGLADQAALAIVNTRLYKDAHRRLERLQALRAIDIAITTNRDLQETLQVLLDKITKQLAVDAAVVLLLDEQRQQLDFAASLGFRTRALRYTRLRLGEGMAGRAALERRVIRQDLRGSLQTLAYAPDLGLEGFESYFAAPLVAQGKIKGVLEVFHRAPLAPDHEWLNFLEALAGQAAIAIESTTLFNDLQRINEELIQAYDSTIEGWSHALDLRDRETEGHTQRVTAITMALAEAFEMDPDNLVHIHRGSLLHDIGKMGVPDHILNKPDKLSDEEWEVMRRHPTHAYELLFPIAYLRPALDIPYCHHEKWDGTGYPRGLAGDQIPLAARVFAVADVFDALTSDRPYRKAWSKERTLEHIGALSGTHFDPQVVDRFFELIVEKGPPPF